MAKKKVVYLLVETGEGDQKRTYWNRYGFGTENKDGSVTFHLDLFPGIKFQIRDFHPRDINEEITDDDIPFGKTDEIER